MKEGYELSLDNAKQLQTEAKILVSAKHYSRAYSLFQLAKEEVGKCMLLQIAMIADVFGEFVDIKWLNEKGFCDHQAKTKFGLGLYDVFVTFAEQYCNKNLSLIHEELKNAAKNIKQIDHLKNSSLYVGFTGNKFMHPQDVVTEEMVHNIELETVTTQHLKYRVRCYACH